MLIWTTTPGPALELGRRWAQIEYSSSSTTTWQSAGRSCVLIATDNPVLSLRAGEDHTIVATYKGSEPVGLHYHPIHDY